jgi:hypothetical protein
MSKGLPDNCPACKKKTEYEYWEINIDSGQAWQEVSCSLCGEKFVEYYELAGWEQI